jgi:hypothetical protein
VTTYSKTKPKRKAERKRKPRADQPRRPSVDLAGLRSRVADLEMQITIIKTTWALEFAKAIAQGMADGYQEAEADIAARLGRWR